MTIKKNHTKFSGTKTIRRGCEVKIRVCNHFKKIPSAKVIPFHISIRTKIIF